MQQKMRKVFVHCGALAFAVFVLCVSKPNWGAGQVDISKMPAGKSLVGVKKIAVSFLGVSDEAAKDGLSEESIHTDILLKFRQAGIPVHDYGVFPLLNREPFKEPGEPDFLLSIEAIKRGELYAFYITAQFKQSCLLQRSPQVEIHATTWSKTAFGTVGAANINQIRDSIKDVTDAFINDYLTMNPKK